MAEQKIYTRKCTTRSSIFWLHVCGAIVIVAIVVGSGVYVLKTRRETIVPNINTQTVALQSQQTQIPAVDDGETGDDNEATWKLVAGDPRDTCFKPTWSGSATIHGWYVLGTNYTEDAKTWNLKIGKNDNWKMPISFNVPDVEYRLIGASPELEAQLKKADEKNPVTLTIHGFSVYCEGNPVVYVNGLE